MRVNIVNQGTGAGGGFDIAGATLTGPLILADDPKVAMEAATKRYIDVAVNSLNAGHIVTGTLPVGRLPAFSGDLSNVAGTNNFTLGNTTVTPGTYTKVTVDAQGRVTAGTGLTAADIPALSWSKITTNKPTTVDGYGITDAVKSTTDNMTGPLTLHAHPTAASHAVTKGYVDTIASGSAVLATGDTIRRTSSTTPTGFLRCNGGLVSKTTYSALYAVIAEPYQTKMGFDYTSYGVLGGGQPWRQQYDSNTETSTIGAWTTATGSGAVRSLAQIVVTKNRAYLLGGYVTSGNISINTFTAPINPDGTLGSWTQAENLPGPVDSANAVVTKNRVYLLGGRDSGGQASNQVFTAPINADGTLGTWASTTVLPTAIVNATVFMTKNRVYLYGGNLSGTGYSAPINSDGTIGTWTNTFNNLPNSHGNGQAILTKNRVYLVGNSNNTAIFTAPINADGTIGSWTTHSSSLPNQCSYAQAIVVKNRAYLIAGLGNNGNAAAQTYTAPINADGTLGTWTESNTLPASFYASQAIVTSSKVYLVGGITQQATYTDNVYVANLSGGSNDYSSYYNGTINKFDGSNLSGDVVLSDNYTTDQGSVAPGAGRPWEQQYDFNTTQSGALGSWTAAASGLAVVVNFHQALVTNGRVLVLGGMMSNGNADGTVRYGDLDSDGLTMGFGAYNANGGTVTGISAHRAIVTKNRVYLIGGHTGSGDATTLTLTAPIEADGLTGQWAYGPTLPVAGVYLVATVVGNTLYVMGYNNNANIYKATIASDGTLGNFSLHGTLPLTISVTHLARIKNRVYLLGGNANGSYSDIYSATITGETLNNNWAKVGNLAVGSYYGQVYVTANRIYLLGGYNGSGALSGIQSAPINADGTLGTWTNNANGLPFTHYAGSLIATKNYLHLLGGVFNGNTSNTVYRTPLTGGLNNYSAYYAGTVITADSTVFQLPDTTGTDPANIYTFIKY